MIIRRSLGRKGVEFTLDGVGGGVNDNEKCNFPDKYIILLVNMLKTILEAFKSYVVGMSWVKIK